MRNAWPELYWLKFGKPSRVILTMGVSTRRLDQFEIFVVFVAGQSRVQTALLVVSVDFWYIVYAKDDI